jgi:ribosomal protein S18 acetylase RimI-like enzyme
MRELALPAIQKLTAEEACIHAAALGAVLADCVAGGASVNFMSPFSLAEGEAFYRKVAGNVASRETVLLAAFLDDRIVGTVQVHFVWMPNQPQRAEIAKMLVHRAARRRGIGAALMRAAEAEIVKAGRAGSRCSIRPRAAMRSDDPGLRALARGRAVRCDSLL